MNTYFPNNVNFNGQKTAAFLGGAVVTNSWVVNSVREMFVVTLTMKSIWYDNNQGMKVYDVCSLTLYRSLHGRIGGSLLSKDDCDHVNAL